MIINVTYQYFKGGQFTNGITQPQLIDNFHFNCHCKPWTRSRLLALRKERNSVLEMETNPRNASGAVAADRHGKNPPQKSFVNFSCSSVSFVNALFHLNYCTPIYLVHFSSQEIITLSSLFSKLLLPYRQKIVCFF